MQPVPVRSEYVGRLDEHQGNGSDEQQGEKRKRETERNDLGQECPLSRIVGGLFPDRRDEDDRRQEGRDEHDHFGAGQDRGADREESQQLAFLRGLLQRERDREHAARKTGYARLSVMALLL